MKTSSWVCSVVSVVVGTGGCASTATMREGPAKPAAELATVDSSDTIVAEIDGKDVQGIRADPNAKSVYLLPAGPHVIGLSLRKRLGVSVTVLRSNYIRICLLADAGHRYTTTAEVSAGRWRPHVVDGVRGEVPITCDQGTFPAGAEVVDLWSKSEIERVKSRPSVDVMASFGWDFGGDEVVRAQFSNGSSQTLAAGQGPFLRVGAMVTPLWLAADGVGIGAGVDIALKLDNISASNADITLIRYPSSFTLHALLRVRPLWYVLLAAGVDKDQGISLSTSGAASVTGGTSLTSRIGGVGRLALYWADTDSAAIMFGLEYTRLAYDAPIGTVRADSAGFFTTVTWRP